MRWDQPRDKMAAAKCEEARFSRKELPCVLSGRRRRLEDAEAGERVLVVRQRVRERADHVRHLRCSERCSQRRSETTRIRPQRDARR
eukprot:1101092-Pleurochrysis_carterae.AAC.1